MRRSIGVIASLALGAVFTSVALAADINETKTFDVKPQSLDGALIEFSKQAGFQIVANSGDVAKLQTRGVSGSRSIRSALDELLSGSGLSYQVIGPDVITIEKPSAPGPIGDKTSAVPLEGIVVTATKRSERAGDVPMSITVIGNQDIERRGLVGMEDYLRSIPGVSEVDNGPQSNAIVIRGITLAPQSENITSGTTVSTYFGETSITGAAGVGAGGIDVRPVDMQRIEVLRGPQGTTFGDASLSGALRLIPAPPKLSALEGQAAASYSNTAGYGGDNTMAQGVLNLPIVKDEFAIRLVGYRYDDSGYYRNVAGLAPATVAMAAGYGLDIRGYTQDDVGRMVSQGGRVSALWQPTNNLDVSVNFLTQTIEQDGLPAGAAIGSFTQTHLPVAPQARVRGQTGEVADSRINLWNAVVNLDLGWSTLTSATSWIDSGSAYAFDYSIYFLSPISSTNTSDFKSFTEELRLATRLQGQFQFLGGLYYQRVQEKYSGTLDWHGAPAANFAGTDPMYIQDVSRKLEQRAGFAEVTYSPVDVISATVGGRYFSYTKNQGILTEGGFVGVPLGTGTTTNLESSESGSTYKANVSYKLAKDSQLYAAFSQGFRLGRPDPGVSAGCDTNGDGLVDGTGASVNSTRAIKSDTLDNYEVGGKFALFDRRLGLDVSAYHIKWRGLPIRVVGSDGPACGFIANAGEAVSDGVELQGSFLVAEGLKIDFGVGYTNARLSEDAPALNAKSGDRLPGAPKVNANLAVQYDFNISGRKAYLRADSLYVGKFFGDLAQTPPSVGGYVKVDARAGLTIADGLQVEVFVKNLTSSDASTYGASPLYYQLRPRTIGVQVGYKF